MPCWGDISFMEAAGSGGGGRGVCRRGRGAHAVCQCLRSRKVACNSIGRSFNKVRKRCNSNDLNSKLEAVAGELRAKLGVGSAMMWILINTPGPTGVEGAGGTGGPGRGAGGWRQGQGGPRDRPLRAVRLACGDLAGGPPPTGTHSGPALQGRAPAPGTPAGPQASTRGADGERAGRRPRAHRATRPN